MVSYYCERQLMAEQGHGASVFYRILVKIHGAYNLSAAA